MVSTAKEGDSRAFGSLINQYYKGIYRFAYQSIHCPHAADEICQETFLIAMKNLPQLKKPSRFKSWLFAISANQVRRYFNDNRKLLRQDSTVLDLEAATDPLPFESMDLQEKRTLIQQLLLEMPDTMRMATILVLMEGLSQKEAAKALHCSEPSISRHITMARKILRVKLKGLLLKED